MNTRFLLPVLLLFACADNPPAAFEDAIQPLASRSGFIHRQATRKATVIGYDNAGSPIRLVARQSGQLMTVPTARAWDLLERHARRDGVILVITSAFRSFEDQVVIADRLGVYGQGGLAAVPGTSPHGTGRALDIDDGRGYRWLRRNAGSYGFRATLPRTEPWHYVFVESDASAARFRHDLPPVPESRSVFESRGVHGG